MINFIQLKKQEEDYYQDQIFQKLIKYFRKDNDSLFVFKFNYDYYVESSRIEEMPTDKTYHPNDEEALRCFCFYYMGEYIPVDKFDEIYYVGVLSE